MISRQRAQEAREDDLGILVGLATALAVMAPLWLAAAILVAALVLR